MFAQVIRKILLLTIFHSSFHLDDTRTIENEDLLLLTRIILTRIGPTDQTAALE
jgi:hypothetical protein